MKAIVTYLERAHGEYDRLVEIKIPLDNHQKNLSKQGLKRKAYRNFFEEVLKALEELRQNHVDKKNFSVEIVNFHIYR